MTPQSRRPGNLPLNPRTRRSSPLTAFFLIFLPSLVGIAQSPFLIEDVRRTPNNRIELRFADSPNYYYRLLQGATPNTASKVTSISPSSPLTLSFPSENAFFRVQRIPRATPLDTDHDGRSDLQELAAGTSPLVRDEDPNRLTVVASSPSRGDDGVAVTRETILTFSRPLAEGSALNNQRLYAEAAGRRALTRIDLSPDRQKATLFYLEPLPGNTRIRVTLDGSNLRDIDGRVVDVDGDGQEGGIARIEFDTLNNSPAPGTAISGRVFASELVPGPNTGAGGGAVHRPLQGVTITVDGMEETLRTTTDADGNFKLTNAPAGRFFVHVDGRTARGSQWPNGPFYPYVGKAWETIPGRLDNRAGGSGDIFLPLISSDTLKTIHPSAETYVAMPPAVLAANPAFNGVALRVPANALVDDSGVRGGRVGLAPVPPDRLPEPLPDDLQFPLVITVQTDGPRNFTAPVPVCFPNLPDPISGKSLNPGEKSALWSFDHDKGYWEVVGPMTVSADGKLVCSDPGTGIIQPGWHGTQPGAGGRGGQIKKEKQTCDVLILGPIVGQTNQWMEFGSSIPAARGGIWRWSTPTGVPNSGVGPTFRTRFHQEGNHTVSIRYMTPNGNAQCTDTHAIEIKPEPCSISIAGPVDVVTRTSYTLTARGSPSGGRYLWTSSDPKLTIASPLTTADGASEVQVITDYFPGESDVTVEYVLNENKPDENRCRDTHTLFVKEKLVILGPGDVELSPATRIARDQTILVRGNLSRGSYRWTVTEGATLVPVGPRASSATLSFSTIGPKTLTAVYTPEDRETAPQIATATINIRDLCSVRIQEGFRKDLPADQPIPFSVTTVPADVGAVTWSAPGGSPSTGQGARFNTQYPTHGPKWVTARYRNSNGDECEDLTAVHIGPIDCRINVTGPASVPVIGAGTFVAQGNGSASDVYHAVLVETGEVLGSSFGSGAPLRLQFVPAFLQPGPYTIRIHYISTFFDVFDGECTIDVPVLVTPAPARSPATLHSPPTPSPEINSEPDRVSGRHLFARINLATGAITRGETALNGVAHPRPLRLAPDTSFIQYILNTESFLIAQSEFVTPGNGQSFELPDFILRPDPSVDSDNDGLSDLAEWIVGSDPSKADTDGDGVTDSAEVRAGTPPTGPDSLVIGQLIRNPTGGYAWDVARNGDRLFVAAGAAGLAVFNVANGQRPVLIGAISTPAPAIAVAANDNLAALTLSSKQLATVDLSGAEVGVARILPLPGSVTAVGIHPQGILAGLVSDSGQRFLAWIDPRSGILLDRREIDRSVEDIAVASDHIYAMTYEPRSAGRIEVLRIEEGRLRNVEGHDLNSVKGAGGRRLRLVVAGDRVYTLNTDGYHVLRRLPSGRLERPRRVATSQAGWRHFGITAAGKIIAASDPVSTDEGDHDIQIHRLAPDGFTPQFESTLPTTGSAEAVTIHDGIAYVADGPAGLQVLRFEDLDRLGRAPSVTLIASSGNRAVEENERIQFTADARDDFAIHRVEFFVNGALAETDDFFPFEFTLITPPKTPDAGSLRLQARATDSGGNVATSPELSFTINDDQTGPWVNRTWPDPGKELDNANEPAESILIWLSEPFDPTSFRPEMFTLLASGPDDRLGTADDQRITNLTPELDSQGGQLRFRLPRPLTDGRYRAILANGLTDLRGNPMTDRYDWDFRIIGPQVLGHRPNNYRAWGGRMLHFRFSRPMDPAAFTAATRAFTPGPDGSPGNNDDVQIPFSTQWDASGRTVFLKFDPPLNPMPNPGVLFGFDALYVQIDRSATDLNGSRLKEDWIGYFFPSTLTDLLTTPVHLDSGNFGVLGSPNSGVEYRIEIPEPVELLVENPRRVQVAFESLDGARIATDTADPFRVKLPSAGSYILWISKPQDGDTGDLLNVKLSVIR